jgi:hypothetical protein
VRWKLTGVHLVVPVDARLQVFARLQRALMFYGKLLMTSRIQAATATTRRRTQAYRGMSWRWTAHSKQVGWCTCVQDLNVYWHMLSRKQEAQSCGCL